MGEIYYFVSVRKCKKQKDRRDYRSGEGYRENTIKLIITHITL